MMMKASLLLLSLVALAMSSDVLDLTVANFDEVLSSHSPIMVEFFAPWCGHCKSLAPEYEKAATALKAKGIAIGKVDATVEEALAQKFGIRGFPTLKLFKNGEFVQDYSGPRSAADIVQYMEKKAGAPYTKAASSDEVAAILAGESSGIVVGYFSDLESAAFSAFQTLADGEASVKFVLVSDSAAASGCMASETDGTIAVLAKDGSKHIFSGDLAGLGAFVTQHAFPQVLDLDPALFQRFAASQITIAAAAPEGKDWVNSITKAGATQPSIRIFNTDSAKWGPSLVRMGVISGNVYPTLVAFVPGADPISWDESVAVTDESMTQWFADVVAGTAKPWKKSEPIPTAKDGHVTVVVADNFEEVVLDTSKNVLVKFYAPWCGHCKNMAPIYDELAKKYADDASVVIAKIDATANYVEKKYGVQGFPTIIFFPAGEGAAFVSYEGTRTLDDMVDFVNTNKK